MKRSVRLKDSNGDAGFTMIEILVSIIVFGLVVASMISMQEALRHSYTVSRQYNEMYTVLSACPEVDRALEFDSLNSSTNCYPNNSFPAEDGGSGTITYTPNLTVTSTSALPASDPLQSVPDSKVVDIQVGFPPPNTNLPDVELRMLITRNGIAQQ